MFREVASISPFLLFLLAVAQSYATQLHIVIHDASGAPLPDQLVIVRSLDTPKEVFRALSDSGGEVPDHDVVPGLYRGISTHPYGWWKTEVIEFFVGRAPASVELRIEPMATHGEGDTVFVRDARSPVEKLRFEFVGTAGKLVEDVPFLVRNEDASVERWFHSGVENGARTITSTEWPAMPDGAITVVALWNGSVISKTFDGKALANARASGTGLVLEMK